MKYNLSWVSIYCFLQKEDTMIMIVIHVPHLQHVFVSRQSEESMSPLIEGFPTGIYETIPGVR